jgi:hypothetical protein
MGANFFGVYFTIINPIHNVLLTLTVPDMGAGCCLGPEGNGVRLGEGDEGGPNPPGGGKMSSQCSARARQHGQGRGRPGKSGMMKKDQWEQSEPVFFAR